MPSYEVAIPNNESPDAVGVYTQGSDINGHPSYSHGSYYLYWKTAGDVCRGWTIATTTDNSDATVLYTTAFYDTPEYTLPDDIWLGYNPYNGLFETAIVTEYAGGTTPTFLWQARWM